MSMETKNSKSLKSSPETFSSPVPVDTVWFDDDFPAGATPQNSSVSLWTWQDTDPVPFSGTGKALRSPLGAGSGYFQNFFDNATATMSVASGDVLLLYVHIKTTGDTSELLVNWYDGISWDHCAQWGDSLLFLGTADVVHGTTPHQIGAIPPAGSWVRLEVPASLVGLVGKTVKGLCITIDGNNFAVDKIGKAFYPPLPPVLPTPLPPGVDLLRPNQDIQIHYWQPRPVFMQLNDKLNPDNPDSASSFVYAPAFVNVFNEATGSFVESQRPKLEIGFTDPGELGPWSALTLRFRAARSRPPEPEIVPETLPTEPIEAALNVYPEPQIVQPMRTDQVGSWLTAQIHLKVDESAASPDFNYAFSPVTEPPGEPAILTTSNPLDWPEGWNGIKVRLRLRARTAKAVSTGDRRVVGMSARMVDWKNTSIKTLSEATFTLTGPTSGLTGSLSDVFTITGDSIPSDTTISFYDNGALQPGGFLFGAGNNSHTFQYTPTSDGSHIISISNNDGISIIGSPITYVSGPGPTPPPPLPPSPPFPYTVTWNPFDPGSNLNAALVSEYEVHGSGTIFTNIDIHGTFFLSSDDASNLLIDVSLDGENYDGIITFDLGAFDTLLVYYRIKLNQGGPTPAGKVAVGTGLQISNPFVTTSMQLVYWDGVIPPAITLGTINSSPSTVPLTSLVRLQVGLTGNSGFQAESPLNTNVLTEDWLIEELVWYGFWDRYNIRDLHVSLTATAILISDDHPYIDVDTLEVELNPYCPGVYPPPQAIIPRPAVRLYPALEQSPDRVVTGWTPEPAQYWLQSRADRVTSDYVVVDPRVPNQLSLDIEDLPTLPPTPSGYVRQWNSIQMRVQAQLVCDTNTQCRLGLRTIYGPFLYTEELAKDPTLYSVQWNYPSGLIDDQINRLYVEVFIDSLTQGTSNTSVYLYAVEIVATYADVLVGLPVSPPPVSPPVSGPITLIDQQGEVYSCGSLGDCTSPQGKLLGRLTIANNTGSACSVSFATDNMVKLRVFNTDTPATTYTLTHTLPPTPPSTPRGYSVNAWVGSDSNPSDPYPVEARSGDLVITVIQGSNVYQAFLPWVYLGL